MQQPLPPASDVLGLVFAAWTAGTATGGVATRAGGNVQAGHFKVVWLVTTGLAVAAGLWLAFWWAVAAACLVTFVSIYVRRDSAFAWLAAAAAWVAVWTSAASIDSHVSPLWVFVYTGSAALMLGAVTNAMLLGHWHLNQPRLSTDPIRRLVIALAGGLTCFAAATLILAAVFSGGRPMLFTGLALALGALMLTAIVWQLVRSRSIMSATGILYLETLLCFAAGFTSSLGALSLR